MSEEGIRARAEALLAGLKADGFSLEDALSVLVSALCALTTNNGVSKEEVIHNVSGGYDHMSNLPSKGAN